MKIIGDVSIEEVDVRRYGSQVYAELWESLSSLPKGFAKKVECATRKEAKALQSAVLSAQKHHLKHNSNKPCKWAGVKVSIRKNFAFIWKVSDENQAT